MAGVMTSPAASASIKTRPPSVDRVLQWPGIQALLQAHGRALTLESVRHVLDAWRQSLGQPSPRALDDQSLVASVEAHLLALITPSIRPVINLTGTVLHTNLGRAPLPREAIDAMVQVASGASNLEYDLGTGKRGDRDHHVESWLCRLTGAEAATVVNNNAAAVLLTLNSLALRKEVVVSRGELIEIGGAFRLPDIMTRAGCKLHEVGTTNRTHAHDYANAISPRTALLLKAHTSNYRVEGFTAAVPEPELAGIAHGQDLPLVVDLGCGSLIDLTQYGLPHEPTPADTLARGADVVTFSGDKLLGGPQAGIIVGRADLIARIRRNPLKRALRCDKQTLAALEAVLRLYGDPDRLIEHVPTLRLLTRAEADIRTLANRLQPLLARWAGEGFSVEVVPVKSQIGSGSLPLELLSSAALAFIPRVGSRRAASASLSELSASLRSLSIPVIGRVSEGRLLLDCRCLEDEAAFHALFQQPPAS